MSPAEARDRAFAFIKKRKGGAFTPENCDLQLEIERLLVEVTAPLEERYAKLWARAVELVAPKPLDAD